MLDTIPDNEILNALTNLVDCIGVREETSSHNLVMLLKDGKAKDCIQGIAASLGLPIRIELSTVPAGFVPSGKDDFHTTAMVRAQSTGRGTHSITAQVSIPPHLPAFGSERLKDYPIQVRVSENCCEYPHTFITVMLHELSHILLACLCSPHRDNELHTDLVPILLGFQQTIRLGRKTAECTTNGNMVTTHTTAYGYLTDRHFEIACGHVNTILRRHIRKKQDLLSLVKMAREVVTKTRKRLALFHDYFQYLDNHPPERRMKPSDAQRIVFLHSHDESIAWEACVTALNDAIQVAAVVGSLNHYTKHAVKNVDMQYDRLSACLENTVHMQPAMEQDLRILRRHVGLLYQMKKGYSNIFRRQPAE